MACPVCGGIVVEVADSNTENWKDNIKSKIKSATGKVLLEGVSGDDLHRNSRKWMRKERTIDHAKDHYKEVVTDPESGEIIHQCEEPLSQHRKHGSGRGKPKK